MNNEALQSPSSKTEKSPDEGWIFIKDAYRLHVPPGLDISENQFRNWCKDGKRGIIIGEWFGRLVVDEESVIKAMKPVPLNHAVE